MLVALLANPAFGDDVTQQLIRQTFPSCDTKYQPSSQPEPHKRIELRTKWGVCVGGELLEHVERAAYLALRSRNEVLASMESQGKDQVTLLASAEKAAMETRHTQETREIESSYKGSVSAMNLGNSGETLSEIQQRYRDETSALTQRRSQEWQEYNVIVERSRAMLASRINELRAASDASDTENKLCMLDWVRRSVEDFFRDAPDPSQQSDTQRLQYPCQVRMFGFAEQPIGEDGEESLTTPLGKIWLRR